MKRILMPLLLTFSVGLNIGLGASLLRDQRSSSNAALEAACQICSDACQRVAALRSEQREASRELATLLAADDPDLEQIHCCLDRMRDLGGAIQLEVVETVLEQRAALPPELEGEYLEQVQRCLTSDR